jgi:hypothetical protein
MAQDPAMASTLVEQSATPEESAAAVATAVAGTAAAVTAVAVAGTADSRPEEGHWPGPVFRNDP